MLLERSEALRLIRLGAWTLVALASVAAAPALANTYAVSLFQGSTGTGSGSFTFTNGGASGPATSPSISTNTSSSPNIGVITFTTGGTGLTAVVVSVNFNDGKNPPNQITGNYVEGLSGTLIANGPFNFSGCNGAGNGCVATLTFAYSGCCAANQNPSTAVKSYSIVVVDKNGTTQATVNGTYGLRDTVNSAPEPGALALLAIALVALAWIRFRRQPLKAGA
jgi:hypothetical protein